MQISLSFPKRHFYNSQHIVPSFCQHSRSCWFDFSFSLGQPNINITAATFCYSFTELSFLIHDFYYCVFPSLYVCVSMLFNQKTTQKKRQQQIYLLNQHFDTQPLVWPCRFIRDMYKINNNLWSLCTAGNKWW